ncbi:MAG: ABC transporter substrate-binding protein [Spirochaetaceae bacterium]|jgi:NitT/TauT family transport system substrate-binding protein|nr:ABC transporter substrate-binding protein [Spirochaetaceae bacterium]
MKKLVLVLLAILAITVILPVFANPQRDEAPSAASAGPASQAVSKEPLRIGIMPDADSLPFMLARDENYFTEAGIPVELVLFTSPTERDAAVQAGKIDGVISDILAAAFLAAGGFDTKITSYTDGRYGIVVSPASGIANLAGLKARKIGLSTNTIIQYTVDAQLSTAGVKASEYTPVAVAQMPLRLQMVLEGQLDAASLPEPLLTAASSQGAKLLSTTDTSGIDAGVMLFSKKVLDSRLADVRAFYAAYYKAAQEINANPDKYRNYLVEKAKFPETVKEAYHFVTYRRPGLPEDAQIEMALAWLHEKGLLSVELKPADLVDDRAIIGF